ncbi:MAG: Eco57I restriction-modification methylase domain-containing protein [Faecalibacterium prausnitzii]
MNRYKQDTGIVMDEDDVQLFHTLSDKLSEQKAAKKETKVHINHQGLTGEEYEKADRISNKPKRERTKEDDDLLKKLQEQKKEREKVIRLLRNVSIRLPLLIYGAKVDLTESIKMADFITLVDEESWQEFMPKTVDKPLFRKLLKYYDEDVVSGAGLRIRRMAKAVDELPPTERVKRIAEIFSHFRNPDKETVLTPWRVMNLHLSSMVGGYCFLNEQFDPQRLAKKLQRIDTWGKEGQPMKFDAIVGNPPYQEDTGGGSAANVAAKQARPVYNLFVDQAKTMQPHYISMIMPARWYAGGIELNDFRNEMLNDPHLIRLTDFVNSKDCFSTVDIAGGICYFLWDRDKEEVCEVTNVSGLERHTMRRHLNEFGEIFIRSNESLSIIHKVLNRSEHFLTDRVQPIDAFGFPSAARGEKEPFNGCISLIHSQGTGYIKRSDVKKNAELIDKYKATISILVPCNGEVGIDPSKGYKAITTPRIEIPGEVNTFSYLVLGAFDTEAEIKNYKQYLMCKFTRFMLRLTYSSMHIARANFVFVSDQDFTEEWTDEKLYKKYELTEDEIAFIESTIRVME